MKRFMDLLKECLPAVDEIFPWDLAEQAEAGYPAVHHSERYEAAYAPAYRVVALQHLASLQKEPPIPTGTPDPYTPRRLGL